MCFSLLISFVRQRGIFLRDGFINQIGKVVASSESQFVLELCAKSPSEAILFLLISVHMETTILG